MTAPLGGAASTVGIVGRHLSRYPAMRAADVYKLAHQACLGAEHAVRDAEQAHRWLHAELEQLGDGPAEPLIDPISADGEIVRVHLRPLMFARLDPQSLMSAFLRTAADLSGSIADLNEWLDGANAVARAGSFAFEASSLGELWACMAQEGYPAAHHSHEYRAAYRPAYRVVALRFLPKCWMVSREHE